MFELALKTIEEKIKQEKSSLEYYQKEIDKYKKYYEDQNVSIGKLERELQALKKQLGVKETE